MGIDSFRPFWHCSEHPIDWNNPSHALAKKEPRRGERAVLRVTVETPQGPLMVYCAHFEVFCGMLARIKHLADIFNDARSAMDKGYHHMAIMGDLNTMAHGIARLSPSFCQDQMRFRSLGSDEAVMWEKYVLSVKDYNYSPEADMDRLKMAQQRRPRKTLSDGDDVLRVPGALPNGDTSLPRTWKSTSDLRILSETSAAWMSRDTANSEDLEVETKPKANPHLLRWGIDVDYAKAALNPGFSCPFPASTTITLDNPGFKLFGISLMRGKLDWMLMRRLAVDSTDVGNQDFSLSDHAWLSADVRLA